MRDAVITVDGSGTILFANPSISEMLGHAPSELVGRDFSVLIPEIQGSAVDSLLDGTPDTGIAMKARHAEGLEITVELTCSEYVDHGERRVVVELRDSDGTRALERRISEMEQEHVLLFERNLAGVYRATLDGKIFECNEACARILGARSRDSYLNEPASSPFMEQAELDSLVEKLRKSATLSGIETGMVRRDGTPVWVVQNMTLIEAKDGPILEATMFDITQKRIAEEQVEYQAHHDTLTGLANTVLFERRVEEAIRGAESSDRHAAFLLIDIDEFKTVNDTIGHNVGNQLLQLVAYRLQKSLRDIDTVARLGGDEFTVILQSLRQPEDAISIAEKLREQIGRPYLIEGHEIHVTASIGISICPEDGTSHADLMRNADIAMYRAKELGRNHIQVCSQATSLEAIERMTLENDLRQAIDRNELVLHFQPQVDAIHAKVHALEALIRWNHPSRGLILPNDFIPLAERSHLMIEIGRWVMKEACRTLARWSDVDPPIRIAINVSPRQFQDEHFLDDVRECLEESGLNPGQLEMEITEGVAMQNPEAALTILNDLKAMGVRISIDDFGTGYSSLSYLTKFPIDCLKIDQGFVQDIEKGGGESAIIAAVIALAHKLKLHVIAEGVETSAQLDFLVGQRCQSLQGYYYSRPQPAEAIEKLIRSR